MPWWAELLIALAAGVALVWLALVATLALVRPKGALLSEAVRLLPDVVRLLRRLAADRELPRAVRLRLWLLLAYLAMPFDLIPDIVPVLGYADDAILVAVVLRSTVRAAGLPTVARHWPGTPDGLQAVVRLARLTSP